MSSPHSAVISLTNLTKKFGNVTAVDTINLTVNKGEVVGFVGPNGAGKTTTISMLLGFLGASDGHIELLGQVITPANAHRLHSRIGYVAGDMELFDNLTGHQYLTFLASITGRDKTHFTQLCAQLQPTLGKPLKKLSRGNKQKVALVGALQHQPELIIFDEPTSGLDPIMQETFLDLIHERHEAGATVFMSSHILSEVAKACDRVIFMKDGTILQDTSVVAVEKEAGKRIVIDAKQDDVHKIKATAPDKLELISEHAGQLIYQLHDTDHANPILKWLSAYDLRDVDIHERELDDIFRHLYTSEKSQRDKK
ncbi:MAG TPA: ABC transporter ATP-binding protein [Candidatus Saccharimonadales bacterium]|jgi:ABC-2 type transport system ATP-binding protein|nr:ABC transporter ATP-binding protein [Candidatus Saccharimonadales bacterium]